MLDIFLKNRCIKFLKLNRVEQRLARMQDNGLSYWLNKKASLLLASSNTHKYLQ